MNKLLLSVSGKHRTDAFLACYRWLALGGELKSDNGFTLKMSDDGMIGFRYFQAAGSFEESEVLIQCDSDVAWNYVKEIAYNMTKDEVSVMQANLALNEIR